MFYENTILVCVFTVTANPGHIFGTIKCLEISWCKCTFDYKIHIAARHKNQPEYLLLFIIGLSLSGHGPGSDKTIILIVKLKKV